jgi:DNA polymerase III delta subunit
LAIDHDAAQLLVMRLGPELQHLDVELGKLAAMACGLGAPRVTRDLVAKAVDLSREEKAWEIQSAIVTGDAATMLRKLRELMDISRQDAVPITWSISDLMRKLYGSAQLVSQGAPPGSIISRMRLFGTAAGPVLQIAGRTDARVLAQLLHQSIETDMHNKSGLGEPQRNLEALLVRIADSLEESRTSNVER